MNSNEKQKKQHNYLSLCVWGIIILIILAFVSSIVNKKDSTETITENTTEITTNETQSYQLESTTEYSYSNSFYCSLRYGSLLDSSVHNNKLIIKAKIKPNLTNKMTIDQNFYNIEDLVSKQGASKFDSIDYWAIADMADGSESKVISFTVTKPTIDGIKNKTIFANQLSSHVRDLYILPSLKQ